MKRKRCMKSLVQGIVCALFFITLIACSSSGGDAGTSTDSAGSTDTGSTTGETTTSGTTSTGDTTSGDSNTTGDSTAGTTTGADAGADAGGSGTTDSNTTGSDTTGADTGGASNGVEPYVGFYQENAAANPEDPVGGFVYSLLPIGDGIVDGEFLFSYSGCDGNLDTGRLSGTKTASSFSGSWTGNVDNRSIGGTFSGSQVAGSEGFTGTYQNDSGKVEIDFGVCKYFVAPNGTFTFYPVGEGTEELTVNTDNDVSFEWNNDEGFDFIVSVLEEECIRNQSSVEACTNWFTVTSASGVKFGDGGVLFSPLITGKSYIASLQRSDEGQAGLGEVSGFASARFIAP